MKIFKMIIHILVVIIGIGLVICGQNGILLSAFEIPRNGWENLCVELFGMALILFEVYLYNRRYTVNERKAKKASKN